MSPDVNSSILIVHDMLDQVLNRAHLDTSLFLKRKTVISPHHAAAFKGGLALRDLAVGDQLADDFT
jgi:hypothetical protein